MYAVWWNLNGVCVRMLPMKDAVRALWGVLESTEWVRGSFDRLRTAVENIPYATDIAVDFRRRDGGQLSCRIRERNTTLSVDNSGLLDTSAAVATLDPETLSEIVQRYELECNITTARELSVILNAVARLRNWHLLRRLGGVYAIPGSDADRLCATVDAINEYTFEQPMACGANAFFVPLATGDAYTYCHPLQEKGELQ